MLVKPQTFMNLSGECIREVIDYYKEDIEHFIVVYDDIMWVNFVCARREVPEDTTESRIS